MHDWRISIEKTFESFGGVVYRYKVLLLLGSLGVLIFLGSFLSDLRLDTTTEGFLHPNDPTLVAYNAFKDQYGREDRIILAIEGDIFTPGFLKKLFDLHHNIETNVANIKEVTSLVNARRTQGSEDALIVEDLMKTVPATDQERRLLKAQALANPLFKNLILSEDAQFTAMMITVQTYADQNETEKDFEGFDAESSSAESILISDAQIAKIVDDVKKEVRSISSDDFKVIVAGLPVMTADLKTAMMHDMRLFVLLMIAIIAIMLFLIFRRIISMFIPLIVVVASVVITFGLMGMTQTAVKVPTQIMPSFLLAVAIGDSIHFLAIFFYHFNQGMAKRRAIELTMGHTALPIILTTLTTAAGISSFSFSQIAPIADLGTFASIGVIVALVLSLVLLPSLLVIAPFRRKDVTHTKIHTRFDLLLQSLGRFSIKHAKTILYTSLVMMAVAVYIVSHVKFSHNPIVWLPKDHDLRVATQSIDKSLKGSVTLEVLVDTKKVNGLYEPKLLESIDAFTKEALSIDHKGYFVGKTVSIVDILKEIHQALNENRSDFRRIADDKQLIAQEFLLFENSGSDDLEEMVDSQFSKTRITLKVPYIDAVLYNDFLMDIDALIAKHFSSDVSVHSTGIISLMGRTLKAAITSTAQSYIYAFVIILLMMLLLVGDWKIGIMSMLPNMLPILVVVAIIVLNDIPLDMFTMMIGSIAIGLAVDDTVHFIHHFKRYLKQTGDVNQAVSKTLETTGKAMVTTTIVLASGFFIYLFASMNNLYYFGLFAGLTIVLALIADFIVSPAMLALYYKNKEYKV